MKIRLNIVKANDEMPFRATLYRLEFATRVNARALRNLYTYFEKNIEKSLSFSLIRSIHSNLVITSHQHSDSLKNIPFKIS